MNSYKDNLLIRLRNQTISLSPKLKIVADYIVIHAEKVQFQTITDLARCTNTSEATVVRMCRDFGFKGYSDFRMALAKDLSSTVKAVKTTENQNIYDQAAFQAISAINDTRALLDEDAIEQVATLIEDTQYVNFIGVGASAMIASYFHYRLTRIGLRGASFNDTHMASMSAKKSNKNEIWVLVSSSGSTNEIVHIAGILNQKDITTIALTNIQCSPLASLSHVTLVAAKPESPLTGGALASKVGAMFLIDTVIRRLCEKNTELNKAFEETADATMALMM